jgi:hypothetical protein
MATYTLLVGVTTIADSTSNDLLIFPVEITKKFGEDADTAIIKIRDNNNTVSNQISVGNTIDLTITVNGIQRKFKGVIRNKKNEYEGNRTILTLDCADVSTIFTHRIVSEQYANQTVEYIVSDLINNYASDVINTVYAGLTGITLESIDFYMKDLKDCLNRLAELSGRIWFVDDNNDLYFDTKTNLKNTTTTTVELIEDYDLEEEADMINRVYVFGGKKDVSEGGGVIGGSGVNNVVWNNISDYTGVWTTDAGGTAFSIGLKTYLVVGNTAKDVWEYDSETDTWTQKIAYPLNADEMVSFSDGTYGYVGGGYDRDVSDYTNKFYKYDPSTNTWTQIANLPVNTGDPDYRSTSGMVAFVIDGIGYVFSGDAADAWKYDPSTNTWTQIADTPCVYGRTYYNDGLRAFSSGGKGYCCYYPDYTLYEYDPSTNTWAGINEIIGRVIAAYGINNLGIIIYRDIASGDFHDEYSPWVVVAYNPTSNTYEFIGICPGMAGRLKISFQINNEGYVGLGYKPEPDSGVVISTKFIKFRVI